MRAQQVLGLIAALTPLGAGPAMAAGYSALPIATFGQTVGTIQIQAGLDGAFEIGSLNDNGQICLVTENAAGGELLLQYDNGILTPIVVGGGVAPGGQWLQNVGILSPVAMNRQGNMVFAADHLTNGSADLGTFLWNAASKSFVPVATRGMPLTYNLTFTRGGNWLTGINNNDEVAFVATVVTNNGQQLSGDFFLGRDHVLRPIALPDDGFADGSVILDACNPSLNDDGVVAFSVRRKQDPDHANSAYLWQDGVRKPLAPVGTFLPDGKQVSNVVSSWVNNANSNVLVAVNTSPRGAASSTIEDPVSLYLWSDGNFSSVAVPGQTMPDGSKLVSIQDFGLSYANDLGQHAFIGVLDDGNTAAYLMKEDGTLSLILRNGMLTNLGIVQNVGQGAGTSSGIALNSNGQVALTARINGGVDTVYLLTPNLP
jgi:hypothetical protein